jgi:hypothetical protein
MHVRKHLQAQTSVRSKFKDIIGEQVKILRSIESAMVRRGSAGRTMVANPARPDSPLSLSGAALVIKLKSAVPFASVEPTP